MKLLDDLSKQLIYVLNELPDSVYCQPIYILDGQSIGQHFRHTIEHWEALINQYESGIVDYAQRKRDKNIETNKTLSVKLINLLIKKACSLKDKKLHIVSPDGLHQSQSSYLREIDAVQEHIIHHAAIIRMALHSIDISIIIPDEFGYAPSTISYKNSICAH